MTEPITAPLIERVPPANAVPSTWCVVACEHGCSESWTVDTADFDPPLTAHAVEQLLVRDLLAHERQHGLDPLEHVVPLTDRDNASFTTAPPRILPDGATLEEAVGQAIGAASSCWDDLAGAGVFDSTRAKAIADELLAGITSGRWVNADRPRPAKLIRAVREGGKTRLEIDGQRFPWSTALGWTTEIDRKGMPGLTLTIVAEQVQVDDSIATVVLGSSE